MTDQEMKLQEELKNLEALAKAKKKKLDELKEKRLREEQRAKGELTIELVKVFANKPELLSLIPHSYGSCGEDEWSNSNAYGNRCKRCYLNEMLEQYSYDKDLTVEDLTSVVFDLELRIEEKI